MNTAPAGWGYFPDFITPQQAHEIELELAGVPFHSVQFQGYEANRAVMHYGWDYAYSAGAIKRTQEPPEWLASLRSEVLRGLSDDWPQRWEEILVTRYPPGAGIGWHREAPMFGSTVVGVSLGAECVMRFRRGPVGEREVFEAHLAPRSVYVISGAARTQWEHSVPPVDTTRYVITFHTVRERWKPISATSRQHRA